MNKLLVANGRGIFINSKAILKTDFNITPNEALQWMLEIYECDAKPEQKIDALLKIDTVMYCNCGIDTTKEEKKAIKEISNKIYTTINNIDKEEGKLLIHTEDDMYDGI